jgi:hypothetical protein
MELPNDHETRDAGTADFLIGVLETHEKMEWNAEGAFIIMRLE